MQGVLALSIHFQRGSLGACGPLAVRPLATAGAEEHRPLLVPVLEHAPLAFTWGVASKGQNPEVALKLLQIHARLKAIASRYEYICGSFPKQGPRFGIPCNKNHRSFEPKLGTRIFGNSHVCAQTHKQIDVRFMVHMQWLHGVARISSLVRGSALHGFLKSLRSKNHVPAQSAYSDLTKGCM